MTYSKTKHPLLRRVGTVALIAGFLTVTSCNSLDVENLNGVPLDQLQTAPTPSVVKSAAQGLMATWRTTSNGHAQTLTKYGFEIWQIRSSNPPSLTQIVSFPQTGGFWTYTGVTNINALLGAVNAVPLMSDPDKAAIRGWAKTILATQLEDMAQAHDTFGIVIDVPADPLNNTPPIVPKAQALARIFQLLDDGYADLGSAGSSFPFTLGPGFTGFNTPANFRMVNRALKARYKVLFATPTATPGVASTDPAWTDALALLTPGTTFINTTAAGLARTTAGLLRGPQHTYTTTTGDATNGVSGTDYYINTRIRTEAQLKTAGGARDDRVALKARNVTSFTFLGVTSDLKATDFLNTALTGQTALSTTTPLPIIRNEELILLRAETNYNLGNLSAAIADINLVRANSGGLPPISDPYVPVAALNQPATLLDEILYEKRMSLWGEIGTTWLDMHHYGKILQIPRYDPSFKLFDIFPIPTAECEVRGYATKGCFQGGYTGL